MNLQKFTATATLILIPHLSTATPSINDMQTCQGLLDFIEIKLDFAPSKYDGDEVQAVLKGLKGYNQYIQTEIISKGLLKYNQGDEEKAEQMQEQVNAYKKNLVASYQKQYPQNRLFREHAISINSCAKQAVPSGKKLEDLKKALHLILKLAKMN